MFHSFGYPDETGDNILVTRFYRPVMKEGVIDFTRTDDETNVIKEVRTMQAKKFGESTNFQKVENEYKEIALQAGWEDGKL
jgi:CRISPR-associated protein Cas5d